MKFFLTIISFHLIISCQPQTSKKITQYNHSSTEVQKLEQEIKELSKKIDENKNQKNEGNIDEKIAELKNELMAKIDQLDIKVSTFMQEQQARFDDFKIKLDAAEENYVSIELFEALKISLEENYSKKEELLTIQIENSSDPALINYLRKKITSIQLEQNNLRKEYKVYFKKSIEAWNEKLSNLLEKKFSDNDQYHKELVSFIQKEVSRINVNIESLNLKIKELEKNKSQTTYQETNNDSLEIESLKDSLRENQILLSQLHQTAKNQINDSLISDIIEKQFSPCHQGVLKNNSYCHTIGTMIINLGGNFINPTAYERSKSGFVQYLIASGVTLKMVIDKTDTFLNSSDAIGIAQIRKCHPGKTHNLLGPQAVWPRAVLLSLFFEKIENEIIKLDEIGIINAEERRAASATRRTPDLIRPAKHINAWWRSSCYQQRFKAKTSDHMYGAAFDPELENFKSLEYYKQFIDTHIFQNDTFGLTHPLKTSGLVFRTGFGAGKEENNNKRLHFAIGSKIDLTGPKVNCDKWEYTHGDNYISLPSQCSAH